MFILLLQLAGALNIMPFHLVIFVCASNAIAREINNKSTPTNEDYNWSLAHTVNYSVISLISLAESLYHSCLNRSIEADLWTHTHMNNVLKTIQYIKPRILISADIFKSRSTDLKTRLSKFRCLLKMKKSTDILFPVKTVRDIHPHAQTCVSAVNIVSTVCHS